MPYGQLEVVVGKRGFDFEAQKLKETDFLHKVNPYVTLSLDKTNIKKTHILQNSGQDVSWNTQFYFDIVEGREATVSLDTVYQVGGIDQWINIARPSGKGAGEIHLIMKFYKEGPTSGPAGSTPYPLPEHNTSYFSRPNIDLDNIRTPSYRDGNSYNSLGPIGGMGYGSGTPLPIALPIRLHQKTAGYTSEETDKTMDYVKS
ncbi:4377_t:CDS:2 [Scutellospora calospora]|uniref:4377_t:CDS:1 n=1 Tax=Scutellospora calospora TaxID=85575 RepID=A0ACA9KD70_9GLOM|nr:4377_t:CDS:2 [Scutellospora calospora]